MKGVILAGGKGTRLLPLTSFTNKHLLPVWDKPMILFPIDTLYGAGIREVLIVTDGKFIGQFKKLLGNGKKYGVKLSFAIQKKADGIAGALKLAKDFVAGESVAVILGDNIFEKDFAADVRSFKTGSKVFLKKVPDPERFGVAEIQNKKITAICEKPRRPKSDLAVVGIYFYDKNVFDIISKIHPSKRGELEITDVNNFYLQEKALSFREIRGFWSDAGTFESLALATKLVQEKVQR